MYISWTPFVQNFKIYLYLKLNIIVGLGKRFNLYIFIVWVIL